MLVKIIANVRITAKFSGWKEIKIGAPQGSVLELLFISGIFPFVKSLKLCKYADDSTVFAYNVDPDADALRNLESDCPVLSK